MTTVFSQIPLVSMCKAAATAVGLGAERQTLPRHSAPRTPSSPQGYGVGLQNLGVTCFLNSILQCLWSCKFISGPCQQLLHSAACGGVHANRLGVGNSDRCLRCAIESFLASMWHSPAGKVMVPREILRHLEAFDIPLSSRMQQDTHEVLEAVVNQMDKESSSSEQHTQAEASVDNTKRILTGMWQGSRQCVKCKCVTALCRQDELQTLSLPVKEAGPICSLHDCLKEYTRPRPMIEGYTCDKCSTRGDAYERNDLIVAPQVLVVTLKRFGAEVDKVAQTVVMNKIDHHVTFPVDLDMQPFATPEVHVQGPLRYRLRSILVHVGSLDAGHYTAFINDPTNGTWWHKNDQMTTLVSLSDVLKQKAYMLFYEREMQPAAPVSPAPLPPLRAPPPSPSPSTATAAATRAANNSLWATTATIATRHARTAFTGRHKDGLHPEAATASTTARIAASGGGTTDAFTANVAKSSHHFSSSQPLSDENAAGAERKGIKRGASSLGSSEEVGQGQEEALTQRVEKRPRVGVQVEDQSDNTCDPGLKACVNTPPPDAYHPSGLVIGDRCVDLSPMAEDARVVGRKWGREVEEEDLDGTTIATTITTSLIAGATAAAATNTSTQTIVAPTTPEDSVCTSKFKRAKRSLESIFSNSLGAFITQAAGYIRGT